MAVYAVPTPQMFVSNNTKTKRRRSQIDRNAELLRNPDVRFEILNDTLQVHEFAETELKEIKEMAKANIVEKHSISIKGVLNIDEDNVITIEVEDEKTMVLVDLLGDFNGREVAINIGESIDIA